LAGAGAAKLLADVPEPEKVVGIKIPSPETAYVLEYPGFLSVAALERIEAWWKRLLGPNAPPLIILIGGMTLKSIDVSGAGPHVGDIDLRGRPDTERESFGLTEAFPAEIQPGVPSEEFLENLMRRLPPPSAR
jgi:hypothetical protein